MRPLPLAITAGLSVLYIACLQAQTPPAAAPKNLIRNPSFESSFRKEDLWDGVDSAGYLMGDRDQANVLTTSGAIQPSSMPVSVSVADLNGDGAPDIAMMDGFGYLRIFFNTGTKTEPKFGTGELASIFLSKLTPILPGRDVQRINLADISRSGKLDLVIGNYRGEILLIPNNGTAVRPDFRQPADSSKVTIPTSKDPNNVWGNVFSPFVYDWNGDGKPDLLIGEGSYSANNIHLLLSKDASSRPVFTEENRCDLAFGDGKEQLSVCVVDYNGDGKPDLLVTDRTGKIGVYLNSGQPWKPGVEVPFAFNLKVGSGTEANLGGIATIATGDFNGDGLFDIVVGRTNGRISLLLNKGTKTEPKFDQPVDLKGDAGTPPFAIPSGWDTNSGIERGNFYSFFSVAKKPKDPASPLPGEDPKLDTAEGNACLKAGYETPQNKVMPVATAPKPDKPIPFKTNPIAFGQEAIAVAAKADPHLFLMRTDFTLDVGKSYSMSFKVRGGRATEGTATIGYKGSKIGDKKIELGERGSAKITEDKNEQEKFESVTFTPGGSWTEVKKDFTVKFDKKELADVTKTSAAALQISFFLQPGVGDVYFDDFKLIQKP